MISPLCEADVNILKLCAAVAVKMNTSRERLGGEFQAYVTLSARELS